MLKGAPDPNNKRPEREERREDIINKNYERKHQRGDGKKEMAHQPQLHSQPKLLLVYVSGFEEEQKEEKRKNNT